jgi:DNA-binding MarR family transcriptional regulator
MLNKTESKVMSVIYSSCSQRNSLLITPLDLKSLIGEGSLKEQELDKIVDDLYKDGYYDLVFSERRGEKVYCITLTEKGKGFNRNKKIMKRNILFRLTLSAGLALFSFIIGLILKAIF